MLWLSEGGVGGGGRGGSPCDLQVSYPRELKKTGKNNTPRQYAIPRKVHAIGQVAVV